MTSATTEASASLETASVKTSVEPAAEPTRRADPSRSRSETTTLGSGSAVDAACVGTTLDIVGAGAPTTVIRTDQDALVAQSSKFNACEICR